MAAIRPKAATPPTARKSTPTNPTAVPKQNAWRTPLQHRPNPTPPPFPSVGASLVVTTTTTGPTPAQRYEGTVVTVSPEGDLVLAVKDKDNVALPASAIASCVPANPASSSSATSAPANTNGFRTDADIAAASAPRRERELQAWQPDLSDGPAAGGALGLGSANPNGSWDQFEANEKMFGVKTSFDEDVYTTKLDRSTADYKDRERQAQKIANEIIGNMSSNPHINEERTMDTASDAPGASEEAKYGSVVRGPNAYVPPAARRGGAPLDPTKSAPAPEVPKLAVTDSSSTSTTAAKVDPAAPSNDLIPTFREFVTSERNRLTQKKQAIVKSEIDKRMSELVKFSQSFKLNKPMPDDLVTILAKDESKQQAIREKSLKDAQSMGARAISTSNSVPTVSPTAANATANVQGAANPNASGAPAKKTAPPPPPKKQIKMFIQAIPAFNPKKTSSSSSVSTVKPDGAKADKKDTVVPAGSPNAANNPRLNANATSFRLNSNAPTFKPPVASPSPKASPQPQPQPNPFFGTRMVKKGAAVHVKDDFNPFKHAKVPEASSVGHLWPFQGKRYTMHFPQLPPPPQAMMNMMPMPGFPPPPPYDEQHAPPPQQQQQQPPPQQQPQQQQPQQQQQQQQQPQQQPYGIMYYAPYPYAGQVGGPQPGMMGVGVQGYMPGPFMQPLPYPTMPPPNGHQMYAPGPPNMPPPQGYMPPYPAQGPPQGPSNGAGRGSMPPTPLPPHAHPHTHPHAPHAPHHPYAAAAYGHPGSPQLSHAVPYQVMMPPQGGQGGAYDANGGGGPPQGQPVQMGHA